MITIFNQMSYTRSRYSCFGACSFPNDFIDGSCIRLRQHAVCTIRLTTHLHKIHSIGQPYTLEVTCSNPEINGQPSKGLPARKKHRKCSSTVASYSASVYPVYSPLVFSRRTLHRLGSRMDDPVTTETLRVPCMMYVVGLPPMFHCVRRKHAKT